MPYPSFTSAPIDKTHPPGYRENNEYSPKGTKKWAACIDIDGGALRPFTPWKPEILYDST